jgi:hypothetical protein
MTVHVGQVTSEVTATQTGGATGDEAETVWEQRCRIAAMVESLARDRLRTATGNGHD